MEEIIVEIKNGMQVAYCAVGHWLTNYDGKDPITFVASKKIYCPLSLNVKETYRCITDDEYNSFIEQKKQAKEDLIPLPESEELEMLK